MTDEQLAEIWLNLGTWLESSPISPLLLTFGRAVATAAVEAERKGRTDIEALAQLRHLVEDLTHCPNPDDPTRRCIKPGAGLMFSNMVNACASLTAAPPVIPEDRAALAEEVKRLAHAYSDEKLARYGLNVHNGKADPAAAFAKLALAINRLAASPPLPQPNHPAVPDGWQLVPKKVSNAMIDAANDVPSGIAGSPPHWQWVWDALLTAAPKEPT